MNQQSEGRSEQSTPRPWRLVPKVGYIMGRDFDTDGSEVNCLGQNREVQVGTVGNYADKELLRFNKTRWDSDAALIVSAVNNHDALVKALDEIANAGVHESAYSLRTKAQAARAALSKTGAE